MWIEQLIQDLRFGARLIWKSPGFAATIIMVLALGTGANTAVFSVVKTVLIEAVPYDRPDEQLGDIDRPLSRTENYLGVIGRLRDGITAQQAQAELDTIAGRLAAAYPNSNERLGISLVSLREEALGRVSTALLILLVAVALVLLIAVANVSNLMLANTATRRREVAVRAALGASRWRVIRQLLAESVQLALAGGAAGWLLAKASFGMLLELVPDTVPAASRIRLDNQMFFFTLAISLIVGLTSGLAPALHATRGRLTESLQQGGRSSAGRRAAYIRDALVAAEVALSLILLVGCGLTVRTMVNLYGVDPGFNMDRLIIVPVTMSLPPGNPGAPEPRRRLRRWRSRS